MVDKQGIKNVLYYNKVKEVLNMQIHDFKEENIGNDPKFTLWTIDNYNRKIISTKIGKICIYISGGWNAKQFEEGKEFYQLKTLVEREEVMTFCRWLYDITH